MLVMRTLLAAAGIAFIVVNVQLRDRIQVPEGTQMPYGQTLAEAINLPVVSGTHDGADLSGEMTVEIIGPEGKTSEISIPMAAVHVLSEGNQLRYLPGLVSMLRTANTQWLVFGLLAISLVYPIITLRWWLLLRARGIPVTLWNTFRLTMVGHFFNFCMPGTTGGDLVKAYYAAQRSATDGLTRS